MIQTIQRKNVNTGEIKNYGLELEASLRLDNNWSMNTNHSFLHMKKKIIASPEYKGYFETNYHNDKWRAIMSLSYIGGLYTNVGESNKKENFCLLNITVDYQLNKVVRLWARGENLLAQSYQINEGYPMPRATFMIGTNLNI